MITAVILAGGKSTRTGRNKLLLPLHHQSILRHAIQSMTSFVDSIVVVSGFYDQEIRQECQGIDRVKVVYNPNYEQGMFLSVRQGLTHSEGDVFLLPGDCPLVHPTTIEALLQASGELRVPMYANRYGHPLFLSQKMVKLCLQEPLDSNLRAFRNKHQVETVSVLDEHVLDDIDTLEEYLQIQGSTLEEVV